MRDASSSNSTAPRDAHLRLNNVSVFVHDQDRSIAFFVDKLGFKLLNDSVVAASIRWVVVAPPHGDAHLSLMSASLAQTPQEGPGRSTGIFLLTDNVRAKHREWAEKGVQFTMLPASHGWSGIHAMFEDPDGNTFHIVESDFTTAKIEAEYREAEERRRAEQRFAQEMAIAASVQSKLFPQRMPQLQTLNYFGLCRQAREVGGDYYDFLELAPGRVAFIVGDVSGKGIAAALLMANLQANLRAQCIAWADDLPRLLASVNQLFYQNSPDSSYATLFCGIYDDDSRLLRYVNCGHLPPLLLRRDGSMERLMPTAGVLGLFPCLEAQQEQVLIEAEDTVLLYTDGATECLDRSGAEFGEAGLLAYLHRRTGVSPAALVGELAEALEQMSQRNSSDDITLLVARGVSR